MYWPRGLPCAQMWHWAVTVNVHGKIPPFSFTPRHIPDIVSLQLSDARRAFPHTLALRICTGWGYQRRTIRKWPHQRASMSRLYRIVRHRRKHGILTLHAVLEIWRAEEKKTSVASTAGSCPTVSWKPRGRVGNCNSRLHRW